MVQTIADCVLPRQACRRLALSADPLELQPQHTGVELSMRAA